MYKGGMRTSALTTTALGGAGIVLLSLASVWALRDGYHDWVWNTPSQGFLEVLPTTAWAALRLWTFWAFATAVAGLVLLRIDTKLGLSDAILGGAAGTWIFAYLAGNQLGPIGLFRSWTIWLILIAAVVWLARNPPTLAIHPLSTGQKLALLACLIMAVSTVPVELGSPVPPYMDALNIPAAVQRILTFSRYLPFDNDPYGYWSPTNQTPGAELLYAFLGFGAGIRLGVLAVTAAMVPMAGLIIFATYRLGRALMGDVAGGMAALLLFADTLLLRAQIGRGTPVAFALVAIGLAFLVDRDRRPMRTAIGALALGTAFAAHAIDGGFAVATAGVVLLIRMLDDDLRNVLREGVCLVGAVLVGLPEFPIALQIKLPYPILPAIQLAGILMIWLGARNLPPRPNRRPTLADWSKRVPILIAFAFLAWQGEGIGHSLYVYFPTLLILCMAGLFIALISWSPAQNRTVYVAAIALIFGGLAEHLVLSGSLMSAGAQGKFGVQDVLYKVEEYWDPYFLVFPAALLFDWIYRHLSKPISVAVLLALLIFPWSQPAVDLTYYEHPVAEEWAKNWLCAKLGWWAGAPDHRWVQSPSELALSEALRAEIRAGRITTATHIVHVTPHATIWHDVLLHSVYTGIDDDIYVIHPDGDLSKGGYAGSRMRPIAMLPAALARNPPYIVVFQEPPPSLSLPPRGYDEIFNDDETIRLYRRGDLAPKPQAERASQ
ncbi:hypothetical protein [Candidatus Binatus sp.]|uniref:hypothetical protein n=1 Tax=Candidatus Binatus sp. TaxID=2811406 RepID=UPI003CC64114